MLISAPEARFRSDNNALINRSHQLEDIKRCIEISVLKGVHFNSYKKYICSENVKHLEELGYRLTPSCYHNGYIIKW